MAGVGNQRVTPANVEARQQARQNQRDQDRNGEPDDRREALNDHKTAIEDYQHLDRTEGRATTDFDSKDLDTLKAMLSGSNSGNVRDVAEHWNKVHDNLVGPSGDGSGDCAYGLLKKAVENVLEHWTGESANNFARHANHILDQISNTASHATTVSGAMRDSAWNLEHQKKQLDAIEEPSWWSSAGDWLTDQVGDDKYTEADIRNNKLPDDVVAQIDDAHLSESDETKLKASAVMEQLAQKYAGAARHIRTRKNVDDSSNIQPADPAFPMPTPVPAFSGSSPTPSTGSPSLNQGNFSTGKKPPEPKLLRDVGVHGGEQLPLTKTKIDGLQQGITGPGGPETFSNGAPTPRGGTTGPGHVGTPGIPGVPQGRLPGGTTGGRTDGRGLGGRPPVRGGIGSGSSEHSTTGGRTGGMRGMHGMGGGGGAGGKGSAAGGRGPLARAKGGVAGAPKGITGGKGPATPGGTGLGRGRGGGASEAGGRGTRGMFAGGMRGSNQRPGDEENEEGSRPDYLVEDEETWTPEDSRSVPRNIE